MVKNAISLISLSQLLIFLSYYLYSFEIYINIQIAFLSSFFVILGSSFAYKRMVQNQVESYEKEGERNLLDTIEDPYELYDETVVNESASFDELDLKEIVKEEKAKIKTFDINSVKYGAKGGVSLFRLLPYAFLVLGFIALENNHLLDITLYIPSILFGIIVGSMSSKSMLS